MTALQLSLFTHIDVQSADKHDAHALLPALDDLKKRDMAPHQMPADSLYGGDTNCEQGREEYGLELISPISPDNRKKMHLADFTLADQGRIVSCPKGVAPDKVKQRKKTRSAAFPVASCRNCPLLSQCPVSRGKKAYYYRYKTKDVRLARRKQHENSAEFKEKYRFRAGIEAAISEFDRLTGIKRLRVRGMTAVCFAVVVKAVGLNILRAARFGILKIDPRNPQNDPKWIFLAIYDLAKEQIRQQIKNFVAMITKIFPQHVKCVEFGFLGFCETISFRFKS